MTTAVADRLTSALAPLFPDGLPVALRCWDGSERGPAGTPALRLRSPAALRHLLWSPGELGLARAYVTGELEVDGDLTEALRRVQASLRRSTLSTSRKIAGAARVAAAFAAVGGLGPRPALPNAEARMRGRIHSRRRDAKVIAHHYDLSNALYALLLDAHMAYSCAYWTSDEPGYTLADAQRDKLDLICRKLELGPGSRLLDVGCGWGALAVHAAVHYGVEVTGITLSEQQLEFASRRVIDADVGEKVRLLLLDYRDLPTVAAEPFDAVSAIEMGEHVGAGNYPRFLQLLHGQLTSGGRLLIQQMSRRTRPAGGSFIETYIAPDMHMRPLAETIGLVEQADFEVVDVQGMRADYVRTIRAWLEQFDARYDEVITLVGEQQARIWRLYLAGGALAFEQYRMGVDQILAFRRPVPVLISSQAPQRLARSGGRDRGLTHSGSSR